MQFWHFLKWCKSFECTMIYIICFISLWIYFAYSDILSDYFFSPIHHCRFYFANSSVLRSNVVFAGIFAGWQAQCWQSKKNKISNAAYPNSDIRKGLIITYKRGYRLIAVYRNVFFYCSLAPRVPNFTKLKGLSFGGRKIF